MPDKLIGEHLYKLLLDGVTEAIGTSRKFASLLEDLRFTLVSLQPRIMQEIREHEVEMYLPNDEIQNLQRQMEEGVKLIAKLSSVGMWNYHCVKRSYSDQLAELYKSLRRVLYILKLKEERDMNELLLVARNIRDRQTALERRLCGVQQEQIEGYGHAGVEHVDTGGGAGRADLEHVYCRLLEVLVLEVDVQLNGKRRFKPVLADLKSTVSSFQPLMEEITDYNNLLHLPNEELENLRKQLEQGIELVGKCSTVPSYKKSEYSDDQLVELDGYLRRMFYMMREKVAKDIKKTLDSVSNLEMIFTRIEGSGLAQNH